MKKLFFALALALLGCSGSRQVTSQQAASQQARSDSHDQAPSLTPHEDHWRSYRDQHALPIRVDHVGDLPRLTKEKAAAQAGISQAYTDLLSSAELSDHAAANFGLGRIHLNLACELLTMEVPPESRSHVLFSDHVTTPVQRLLAAASERFTAASKMEGGDVSVAASEVVSAMLNASEAQLCESTRAHWAAASRPEGPSISPEACLLAAEESLRVDQPCVAVLDAACMERAHLHACTVIADHWWGQNDAATAVARWERACGQGDEASCDAKDLTVGVTDRAADALACTDKRDVTACFRAANAKPAKLAQQCTATSAPPPATTSTRQRCHSGDAMACWAVLGALLEQGEHFPESRSRGGGFGVFGSSSGPGDLEQQCLGGNATACSRVAATYDGHDALQWHERACNLSAPFNCHRYAKALFELNTEIPKATTLLVQSCDERDEGCLDIASRFHSGNAVTKSSACAAALALKGCAPDKVCSRVNVVFHGER